MDNGLIYVAIVNVVIWLGLVFYLFSLDSRIKKLEREERRANPAKRTGQEAKSEERRE
jgi:CcmD family protein